jgi:signal transduction histidine kinase
VRATRPIGAAWLAGSGWIFAAVAALSAIRASRTRDRRLEAVARAAHELRGPIGAARLGLSLGIRTGGLPAAKLRALDLELERAGVALADLSAIHAPAGAAWVRELVDPETLLRDCVESWQARAAVAGAQLVGRWSGPVVVVGGDRIRLAQAMGNLIANAIEHGGGAIEVRGRTDHTSVRLEVIDGGPGLPAPVAELAGRARAGRGTRGRGLAIASSIAREHGGRLAARPSERGARLVLELPANRMSGFPAAHTP